MRLTRFGREASDDRGQVLILTAFSMVALLGMAALALDVSYAYDTRNKLAMTADAAAQSAAVEIWRGNSSNYATFAHGVIGADKGAGRIPAGTSASVRLCTDTGATCLPAYNSSRYVEVILSSPQQTYLGAILNTLTMAPTARAVAGTSSGPNCLMTLTGGMAQSSPAAGAHVTAENCNVAIAGQLDVHGTLTAAGVTAGSCINGCSGVTIGPPPSDPLASLPTPTSADCNNGLPGTNVNVDAPNKPLTHGTYRNVSFDSGSLLLGPGIYCITGEVAGSTPGKSVVINGTSGVLIYMTPTGSFNADNNGNDIKLYAQTTGSWAGIAFFQDRNNHNAVTFAKNNGPDFDLNGAIYAPGATVKMKNANASASLLCGIFVAAAIDWDKPNMTFRNDCTDFGGSPLTSISLAE